MKWTQGDDGVYRSGKYSIHLMTQTIPTAREIRTLPNGAQAGGRRGRTAELSQARELAALIEGAESVTVARPAPKFPDKHTHDCGRTGPPNCRMASCRLDCPCWCHVPRGGE